MSKGNCPKCQGDGYTSEHDPNDPHIEGCSTCPIQVQCETCLATGFISEQMLEVLNKEPKPNTLIPYDENDLPF